MLAGFLAALCGDWLLAVKGSPPRSAGFLGGVAAFALAHLLWMSAHVREARPDMRAFVAFGVPLAVFAGVRLMPVLPSWTGLAVTAYAVVTALDLSMALSTRRLFYSLGVALLALSDVMIGMRMLRMPGCGMLAGPIYVAAEASLIASFLVRHERRLCLAEGDVWPRAVVRGTAAFACFVLAAVCFPGGGYNPCMRMLSALGRTTVRGVAYPWCHYLFMAGMGLAAAAAATVLAAAARRLCGWRRLAAGWGTALNVAGLCTIALVPENVNQSFHNVGCWLATGGGAALLAAMDRQGRNRVWTCVLLAICAVFGIFLSLHGLKVISFAPWVPTMQKLLIVAFAVWTGDIAWQIGGRRISKGAMTMVAALIAITAVCTTLHTCMAGGMSVDGAPGETAAQKVRAVPFTDDEHAALAWLDHVTGDLPADEERDWWHIGGTQHGLFAKRYSIAFCGYAAAALGARGGSAERAVAGRILGNCITRILKRDAWAYSMSKNYWGRAPWAPDPCYRENLMYTGHLLQLLALYETFTGDTRYWTNGFDFVWNETKRVHYNVQKLIDVTVFQMRKGPNGGITCEPGLMFFPCNNHPHVALALFSRLGHGDWRKDARRWEKWALAHYASPLFGGGVLNLVYHVRSGLMYPRGHGGLDGWSLLWYEPWAADRGTAIQLWEKAARAIDWESLEQKPDELAGSVSCCTPIDVPPLATVSFLAAAARACDDPKTAIRLEALADRTLVRRDGFLFLEGGRDWRIGATANRIISLAESNGFRFRALLEPTGK